MRTKQSIIERWVYFALLALCIAPFSLKAQTTTEQNISLTQNYTFPDTIPLVFDPKSGKSSTYQGQGSKTTDKYENGTADITTKGPITYTLTPSQLAIGPNQTKTWNGSIGVDMNNVSDSKFITYATLKSNYKVTYSRPVPGNPNASEMVNKNGLITVNFQIYPLSASAEPAGSPLADPTKDTVYVLKGGTAYVRAVTWPPTPIATVTVGATNANIQATQPPQTTFAAGSAIFPVAGINAGLSFATVTNTCQGLSVTATIPVKVLPQVQVFAPPTVAIAKGDQAVITARGIPGISGYYRWATNTPGLTLVNAQNAAVTVQNTALNKGTGTVTVSYTYAGQTVSQDVTITPAASVAFVPTSLSVKVGKSVQLKAIASPPNSASFVVGINNNSPKNIATIGNTSFAAPTSTNITWTGDITGVKAGKTMITATYITQNEEKATANCNVTVTDGVTLTANPTSAVVINNLNKATLITLTGKPQGGTYTITQDGNYCQAKITGNSLYLSPASPPVEGMGVVSVKYTVGQDYDVVQIPVRASSLQKNKISFSADAISNGNPILTGIAFNYKVVALDGFGNDISSYFQWRMMLNVDKYKPTGVYQTTPTATLVSNTFARTWAVLTRQPNVVVPAGGTMPTIYWMIPNNLPDYPSNQLNNIVKQK